MNPVWRLNLFIKKKIVTIIFKEEGKLNFKIFTNDHLKFRANDASKIKMIIDTISEDDMDGFIKDSRNEAAQRMEHFKVFNVK